MLNAVSTLTKQTNTSATSNHEIPLIDIAPLIDKSYYQSKCLNQIKKACSQTGFFAIKNHGIKHKTYEDLLKISYHFFKQTESFKRKYQIGSTSSHCGYVPFTENGLYDDESNVRLYEAFDLSLDLPKSDHDHQKGNIFYGPNIWPDIPHFKQIVSDYFQRARNLSHVLTSAFENILDMPSGHMLSKMQKPTSQLRLIHYIENPHYQDQVDINMGAHTDYELFTILFSNERGLQTQNLKGQWIDVPVFKNALTINIGDMLEVWSGGQFKSNLHRVNNLGIERFSFPYFASLDYDTIVEPWKLASTTASLSKYPPIKAGEHLLQQVTRDFAYLRKQLSERSNPFLAQQNLALNPFQNTVLQSLGE
ncbi:isopenicillin N synthase family dioxygenase [Aliikangiella sp. IMCC44359]|uniref:isopenicillin N synthase family dioxygenase n=1 Tax=Aliikangiella sp. IMCC44359 TaxID=3459125 RepID=UPI00403B248F